MSECKLSTNISLNVVFRRTVDNADIPLNQHCVLNCPDVDIRDLKSLLVGKWLNDLVMRMVLDMFYRGIPEPVGMEVMLMATSSEYHYQWKTTTNGIRTTVS